MKRYDAPSLTLVFAVIACVLVALAACGSTNTASSPDDDASDMSAAAVQRRLTGHTWELVQVGGRRDITYAEDQDPVTLTFDNDGTFTGYTGCNTVNGSYELRDGLRIDFSQSLTTLRACPDADDHERILLDAINAADNLSFGNDGERLSLNKARMAPLATFAPQS